MAKGFEKRGEITSKTDYDKILRDPEKWVPSSLLSYNDKATTIRVEKLIAVEYGTTEDKVYAAFECSDVNTESYRCQLPVTYVRKVFSGKATDGSLIAGKCTGSLVNELEKGNFSWDIVKGLIGKSLRVSSPTKIITTKDGKDITHRIYRLDLVEEKTKA